MASEEVQRPGPHRPHLHDRIALWERQTRWWIILVAFTVDKPQYGAFAAPIGVLFALYLQTTALYGSAALTAGIADRDIPLEVLRATDVDEAQAAVEQATRDADDRPDESSA